MSKQWDMLKRWVKKHWKHCLCALCVLSVFIIAIPLIINILFKIHSPVGYIAAEWDASAALTFYGTLLSSVITVFGVYLTIQYSRENYKEDVRNRVLPYIDIEILKTKSHYNTPSSDNEAYIEYQVHDYYCILNDGKIEYKSSLTKEQKQVLQNVGTKWIYYSNGCACIAVDDICVPLEFKNVGNGTAINFIYGLNRTNITMDERQFVEAISLKVGGTNRLNIFSEDCGENSKNIGKYVLFFAYSDIYKNKYEQRFNVSIEYNEEHGPVFSISMEHTQTLM